MRIRTLLVCLILLFASRTLAAAPAISSLSPTSGAVGASVTISGSNFGSSHGTSTVKFNGKTATISSWSASTIVAVVPSGATTGNLVVTVSGVASNGKSFTVVAAPSITSLSPTSAAVGASITINGSNFGSTTGTVKFNGTPSTPTSWTSTTVKAPVPSGATTGNVTLHASGVDSNGKAFTVLATPTISSYSPSSGLVGTDVTINGSNFGSTKGTVTFNGTSATAATWTSTKITVVVPAAATSGPFVIGASGVNVTAGNFAVLTLSSISVTPANLTLALNSPQRFFATATYSDGSQGDISPSVTWSSLNTSVATIDSTGASIAIAQGSTTIQASLGAISGSTALTIKGRSFLPTGSLNVPRSGHTATPLPSGKVLVVGGSGDNSSELYDPVAKTFSYAGALNVIRGLHSATMLQNGKILIAGGVTPLDNFGDSTETATAELYDPSTQGFTPTGSLNFARQGHTATLLQNGQVLVVGGFQGGGNGSVGTAELYDPVSGTFTVTGSLSVARTGASATLLNDGTVLVAGGLTSTLGGTSVATAEIYNPTTGTFTVISNLPAAQYAQSATLLSNGTVVLAGGATFTNGNPVPAAHVYIYDPVAQTFSVIASLGIARSGQTATVLKDGTVLLVGGENPSLNLPYDTAEVYTPSTQQLTGAGATSTTHTNGGVLVGGIAAGHTTTLLPDGTVLFVGGTNQNPIAELYEPGIPAPVSLQITPGTTNFLTGANQLFTAVDDQGQTRLDAIWSVSDPNVLSLPSNASGQITAANPGQATLTANVDGVIANLQITVAPHSLQITPGAATLLVGDSRQFTVVDERGKPSPIATWSVDNQGLASLTSDASTTLTALAAGTVNLTATVEGVSMQIPVTISGAASFAPGSVLWSAPPASGYTPQGLFQAVPTDTGPSLYSVQAASGAIQTLVQAFTSDGQQLWQTALNSGYAGLSVPDGFGGMIVSTACDGPNSIPLTLNDINSQGGSNWSAQITSSTPGVCPPATPKIAIGQDGAVVVANVTQVSPPLAILDGQSGAALSLPAIPASTFINSFGEPTTCDCLSILGQPIVDSDGSTYVEYEVRTVQFWSTGASTTNSSALYLLKLAPDYTTATTLQLTSATLADVFPSTIIPDGNGGVLATWTVVDSFDPNTNT
ncbi:MAG TPA: IPT/TIG domain-containing protein, partial [Candidatus Acidoferrales bacterium]|nr:IPT/TIG domain-containing protein [Candidatus Acidoferrales bacterium]